MIWYPHTPTCWGYGNLEWSPDRAALIRGYESWRDEVGERAAVRLAVGYDPPPGNYGWLGVAPRHPDRLCDVGVS